MALTGKGLTNLKYSLHGFSSYSSSYVPDNILVDRPSDQSSRWSSGNNASPQFLTLKLERLAIVKTVTFGKFEKSHVCNLKKFKIYGGVEEENLMELLEGGLKNDNEYETFLLKHTIEGNLFPCRFLKVVPLLPHGNSFNYSIWYVVLKGVATWEVVDPSHKWLTKHREKEAVRLCLKHLRQHNYSEAFETLQKKTRVSLEDPLLTILHKTLVEVGDYEEAENCVRRDCENGLFKGYLNSQECKPVWKFINPPLDGGIQLRPGMRGGHQMCVDVMTETIYLYGGWDGTQDLADFWSFHIPTQKWTLISGNAAEDGGPTARSCHKMTLDQERRQIFMLGRYIDSSTRTLQNTKSDFYLYDLNSARWTLITDDTSGMGGPKLIFDHQQVLDTAKRVLYVFGGRVLTCSNVSGSAGSLSPVSQTSLDNAAEFVTPYSNVGVSSTSTSQWTTTTTTMAAAATFPSATGMSSPRTSSNASSSARADHLFSGLYSYDVSTNTWTLLREDAGTAAAAASSGSGGDGELRSRIGHSMLFHPGLRKLFIFAGQRGKEYINDFLTYDVDADRVQVITSESGPIKRMDGQVERLSSATGSPAVAGEGVGNEEFALKEDNLGSTPLGGVVGGAGSRSASASLSSSGVRSAHLPAAGFTQRATIDPDLDEIHVLSGLSKDKDKREENVRNSFWIYSIPTNRWTCVYKNENLSPQYWDKMHDKEPVPRFAHQLVYDHVSRVHYLFGGNPGKQNLQKMRLDDFWSLQLTKVNRDQILNKCVYLIRKYHFLEMVNKSPLEATAFLQTKVSAVVNHESEEERQQFHLLASRLFAPSSPSRDRDGSAAAASSSFSVSTSTESRNRDSTSAETPSDVDEDWRHRMELFDLLVAYYPEYMTQPKQNLVDLVAL